MNQLINNIQVHCLIKNVQMNQLFNNIQVH